ncbi:MAG: GNAT family N-acetyltransferase [Pseudomonadota bacterium]
MRLTFRDATVDDIPDILALLEDDRLGAAREGADPARYIEAFEAMRREGNNRLLVGEVEGKGVVATCQLTFISGLSLRAARRAQVESVRVARALRGQGLGRQLFDEVDRRAREAGCTLIQLTMNESRTDSAKFYTALGFTASHIGYKRDLM